ncbi:MAG TPA: hypothetical protein VHB01_06950 [Nitrosospira sp.]|nr:hypothetical protein [Nitrosospira sp.]
MEKEEQVISSTGDQSASKEDCRRIGTAITAKQEYLPYPKAIASLSARLGATPEELAGWIFIGPENGGLCAYRSGCGNGNYRLFIYAECPDISSLDYIAPLYRCWFLAEEIETFTPQRYITGKSLIARWGPFIKDARSYVAAKIMGSQLLGFHPIAGVTEITYSSRMTFPSIEDCLFAITEIEKIEVSDIGRNLSPREKLTGHLNHDLQIQQRANEIATVLRATSPRAVTRNAVAKILASEFGITYETVLRRIRKQWK